MDFGKLAKLGKVVEKISEPAKTPVIPMPNRWFLEPDKFPHMQPLVEKVLAANQMQRPDFFSGAFVDPRTGKVLDFGVMNDVGVAIDPKTNRPKMSGVESGLQSFNEVPATAGPSTKSNLVRKGLFKRTGGDPLLDQINFLATIERSGAGHQYGLATEYATPAELLNTMTGANPTLRPHSRGDLFGIGDVIGQIVTPQGAPKDVYESLLVAPKGSDVQGVKLHKAQGGAVHMKDGTDEAIRKILEESKRETGKITRYEPRQSSKISAEERAQWDQRAKEQAARETAVKRGLQSWGTDIPGTIADLAVDLPYNLAQRAAGRRGDNVKPLGAGEAVRSGFSSALGWTQPQAEPGMQPQNDWLNDAITNILQATNPVALTAAGDPVAAARLGKKGVSAVGKEAGRRVNEAMLTGDGMLGAALAPVAPRGVVKPQGGNWLEGGTNALKGLTRDYIPLEPPYDATNPAVAANNALNQWVDKQLTRYVKNQMATPEDPIRALAEKGTLHYNPESMPLYMEDVWHNREKAGFPAMQGTSPLAQRWEAYADQMIRSKKLGETIRPNNPGGMTMRDLVTSDWNGEWALKAPDDQLVHELRRPGTSALTQVPEELGFPHLIDELRNATNPASGLPRELLIKPESLSKLSVPQAVERVAKINEWRAAQKAEADALRAMNPATFTHKEYPEGYRWVELKQPEGAENTDVLADALKYEGETMGHCVGGYCPDVSQGRSRIYSLRDKKGQPHVTVEVQPSKTLTLEKRAAQIENLMNRMRGEGMSEEAAMRQAEKLYPESETLSRIVQIRGKANRAPNEEYLPYVQDFVRSGQWSDVGDLHNTGLVRIDPSSDLAAKMKSAGKEPPPYVSQDELTQFLQEYRDPTKEGMKKGGAVKPCNQDAMQMAVWDKAVRKNDGGQPTQAEIEAAMRPMTFNPKIASQGEKTRALMEPPSVTDPRYAEWKKIMDDAELFSIASDLALNAIPFAGPVAKMAGKGLSKAVENAAKVDPYFSGSLGSQRGAINIGGWARSAKRSAEEAQRLFDIAKGTRAKSAQEAAGLYHPIGGGIKLSKPIELMEFETVKDPTVKGVKRRIITPEKMQGGIGIPLVGDRAAGGKLLTSLEGTQFSEPLTLEAGPDYMLTHTIRNSPESSIWRSGKGIISGLQKQVEMVRDMGRPIYGVNMVGSPTMVNYNTMVAEAILNQYNPAALTKKAKKEFLKDIRNYAPDADKPHLKPGAVLTEADMNDVEALRAKMLAEGAGPLRKAFVERMELEPFQNMGFPDVSASRLATTEPLLVDVPTGSAGFTIGTIDPAARALAQTPRGHKTYPIALGGEYFGSLESPVDYRNIFQEFADKRRLFGKPEGSDWRSFSLAPQFQTFDQEWLDRYMKSMGASNPREWKKGGVVQKAKGGAVKKAARKAGGGAAKQSGKITAALKQENLDAMRLAVMDKKLRKHHA